MTRVLIAAGGTAGHVVPALAVADELRARDADIVWLGGERSEAELVPAAGYPLRQVAVRGLSRSNPLAAARAAALAARATARAAKVLRAERPDVVFGGGGYVAGPAGLAAVARRVPSCSPRPTRCSASPTACSRALPAACAWPSRSPAATARATA